MTKLTVEGPEPPLDLLPQLTAAGFDLNRPITESKNPVTLALAYVQDEVLPVGTVLVGRRIFCGLQPQGSVS